LNQNLHYSFDHEFFLRTFFNFGPPLKINKELSAFRLHNESKTVSTKNQFRKENKIIAKNFIRRLSIKEQLKLWSLYFLK